MTYVRAPAKSLLLSEGLRSGLDLARLAIAWPVLSRRLQAGDGHSVLVLPGFMAANGSTATLRGILRRLGYQVSGWKLGRNWGLRAGVAEGMSEHVQEMAAQSKGPVSIVGQSLGGTFGREIAKQHPDLVRQVISLGSPFSGDPRSTNAWRLYQWATGEHIGKSYPFSTLRSSPPVPTTSIYSRLDGVVAWQNSIERVSAICENIEIASSHIGMAVHPGAIVAIADRLAQWPDIWKPFKTEKWSARFFPRAEGATATAKKFGADPEATT